MKKLSQKYILHFTNKAFTVSVILSIVMFAVAIFINFCAGTYATEKASNSVTDIVLNNIRTYDVDGMFIYGTFIFWGFLLIVALYHIHKFPFIIKTLSLFIIIRSIFISLTHIGPFPSQIQIMPTSIISKFSFGGDLFFSGHTGIPFLIALIFWDIVPLRITFLLASLFFGTIVLLGHLHYSIDVLSAFFITFTIFHLAKYIFPHDFLIAQEEPRAKAH